MYKERDCLKMIICRDTAPGQCHFVKLVILSKRSVSKDLPADLTEKVIKMRRFFVGLRLLRMTGFS